MCYDKFILWGLHLHEICLDSLENRCMNELKVFHPKRILRMKIARVEFEPMTSAPQPLYQLRLNSKLKSNTKYFRNKIELMKIF